MKKYKNLNKATNAVDPATTKSKDWGFIPIPGKFGKTTNAEIKEKRGLALSSDGAEQPVCLLHQHIERSAI